MLIQFSVKNYMSFRDEVILALNPSKDDEHPENIIKKNGYSAINSLAIYGANASGKTSLFKAMTMALVTIKNSNVTQVNQPINGIEPFKFDETSVKEPSEFEFVFIADDNKKYVYGFSCDKKRVYEEYLYQYNSKKPSMIFERADEKYEFKAQKKLLDPLVRFNTPNKLFLSTATNWNTECTIVPYKWLTERISTFTDAQILKDYSLNLYKSNNKKEYITFTEKLLQAADINISKLNINIKKMKINMADGQAIQQVMPGVVPHEVEQMEVITEHSISNGKGHIQYDLGLGEESLGTNQLFFLGPFLKDALENGETVVIDEIDKSLHTFIVKYIINMFRDKKINESGAQLIFTTHATPLLSLSTFRRDQIYFTEKNNETGVSDLYSLDEFPVRKTENIEKGYLLGRYGAIPYIRGEEL